VNDIAVFSLVDAYDESRWRESAVYEGFEVAEMSVVGGRNQNDVWRAAFA
jgi:hypothetical protein